MTSPKPKVTHIDLGDQVFCDMCNADYTNKSNVGGITFGSKAVCPECVPRVLADAAKFRETHFIGRRAGDNEQFRHFVHRLRGGEPGSITVTEFPSTDDFIQGVIDGKY